MSKFKVGDEVIVVKKIGLNPNQKYEVGSIGVVIGSNPDCSWGYVYFNGHKEDVYWSEVAIYKRDSVEQSAEQIKEEIFRINTSIEKSKKDIEEAEEKRKSLVEQLREKGFLLYEKDSAGQRCESLSVEDVRVGEPIILTRNSLNDYIPSESSVVVELNDKSEIPFKVRCLASGKTD